MLKEWEGIRQRQGEGNRRWFVDETMDLIVWFDGEQISGFQLCYDKGSDEKALTWRRDDAPSHTRVDSGESRPGTFKSSPVLSDALDPAPVRIRGEFDSRAADLPGRIRELVDEVIDRCGT
jgi:hypothetical protein